MNTKVNPVGINLNVNNSQILEIGYQKLLNEYRLDNLPIPEIKYFGINHGWNAVIGTFGCCGIAMSFQDNNPLYGTKETMQDTSFLKENVGSSLFSFVALNIHEISINRRSIALATLNALSQPFLTDDYLKNKGYTTEVDVKEMIRPDDNLVIVGYGGIVKSYSGRCRELHVTDQRLPSSFKTTIIGEEIISGPLGIDVHPSDENQEVLANADVAIITGSTLVNGTFEEVLGYAENARLKVIYGSSAELIPDVLFDCGIDVIMSVAISDPLRFEHDLLNSPDMETSLRKHQRKYNVGR